MVNIKNNLLIYAITYQITYQMCGIFTIILVKTNLIHSLNFTTMAHFNLQANGFIYLVNWISPQTPFKISPKIEIDLSAWNKVTQQPID
jgi:hypothetical protein